LPWRIDVSETSFCCIATTGASTWRTSSTLCQTFYTISAFSLRVESVYTWGVVLTTVKWWATHHGKHTC
jgi:hypothetical protein